MEILALALFTTAVSIGAALVLPPKAAFLLAAYLMFTQTVIVRQHQESQEPQIEQVEAQQGDMPAVPDSTLTGGDQL